jgi:HlyD family secretion protein
MDIPRKSAKRMKMIRRGLMATTGLVVVAVVTVGVSRLEPASPGVDRRTLWLDTVKRGPMLRQVRGVGTLVSEDILWVPAAVAGRVVRVLVEPGTLVEPNTVILELNNPQLDLELLNAKSQWSSAQARLTAQKATTEDQLLGMEASRAQMQADHREAKLRAEVDQKQFESDLISELLLTLSKTRVEQLEMLLEVNKKRLDMFRTQTMPAQLAEAEASVLQAQSLYELKRKEAESLHVRAGTNGVLAQVKDKEKIEPGQSVSSGTILAKVTNPRRLKAQLKIPEAQARDVIIGLPAEVDTHHGTVSGKVSRIDPTVMEGNVTVDVSLDGALPLGARPDLSVVGTIEIERLDDILYVGRPVVASAEGVSELFKVVEGGKFAVRTRAQFGRNSVSTIEVLDGLQIGDEIILSDMSQWDEHDKIRLK